MLNKVHGNVWYSHNHFIRLKLKIGRFSFRNAGMTVPTKKRKEKENPPPLLMQLTIAYHYLYLYKTNLRCDAGEEMPSRFDSAPPKGAVFLFRFSDFFCFVLFSNSRYHLALSCGPVCSRFYSGTVSSTWNISNAAHRVTSDS